MPESAPSDNNTPTPQPAPTQPAAPATPAPAQAITSIDQIPQALRNQLESQHRKGLQERLQQAEAKAAGLDGLRQQSQTLLEQLSERGVQFEEGSDFGDVALQLTGTLDSLKTEKEKLDAANKTQGEALSAAQKQAETFKSQYENTLINHASMRELAGKVVEGKAGELVAAELSKLAKVGEDGTVGYEMDITDENGHTAKQLVDAATAVGQLEANVKDWGFAFKSTVNAGSGAGVTDGIPRSGGGLDVKNMTQAQHNELMKTEEGRAALYAAIS